VTVDTSGRAVSTVPLEGGHLALDFVNTVGGLYDDPDTENELLDEYEDVPTWCARLGVISEREAGSLRAAARRDPAAAQRALAEARRLRELIDGVFRPLSRGDQPPPELLDRLRDAERDALADARLTSSGDLFQWSWPKPTGLADPLKQIAHAAVELLTAGPLERLKTCAHCRWLFLDKSRNHSRRWCSMEECGIQEKHARFVERRRRAAR
jgi:predicted RNA-binding Zn ribbon-like protein